MIDKVNVYRVDSKLYTKQSETDFVGLVLGVELLFLIVKQDNLFGSKRFFDQCIFSR